MVKWKPFDMPCGIEAAIRRLARESKRDGFANCTPQFYDGEISYVSLFDYNNRQYFVRPCGDKWEVMDDETEGEDGSE